MGPGTVGSCTSGGRPEAMSPLFCNMAPKTRAVKTPEKEGASPPPKAEKKAPKTVPPSSNRTIGVAIGITLLVAASLYTLSLPKTEISEWEIPDHFWCALLLANDPTRLDARNRRLHRHIPLPAGTTR